MNVTVIVSTRNRCEDLAKALASLAASELPDSVVWEVLVVDNASTDATRGVVEDFAARYPGRFRYLYQAVAGKSLALNAAVRETRADVLAFTDDDVSVEPSWLGNLVKPLKDPAWAGVSGRTLAARDFWPPDWLAADARYALAPLGLFDRGTEPGELAETPFGNNMAYRKAVFDKYGGFRTDLGPRSGSSDPQKSEDSEFGTRLLSAGERLRYEPSALLYHSTPQARITRDYFLAWWFDKARADIRAFGVPSDTKWFVAGSPYYFYRRTAVWTFRWLFSLSPAQRFSCKVKLWVNAGQIAECHRLWREAKAGRPPAPRANPGESSKESLQNKI
jgi:glucosyl-dolichyl phosphate glucuronosyltransferase